MKRKQSSSFQVVREKFPFSRSLERRLNSRFDCLLCFYVGLSTISLSSLFNFYKERLAVFKSNGLDVYDIEDACINLSHFRFISNMKMRKLSWRSYILSTYKR